MYFEFGSTKLKSIEIIAAEYNLQTNYFTIELSGIDVISGDHYTGSIELTPLEADIVRNAI